MTGSFLIRFSTTFLAPNCSRKKASTSCSPAFTSKRIKRAGRPLKIMSRASVCTCAPAGVLTSGHGSAWASLAHSAVAMMARRSRAAFTSAASDDPVAGHDVPVEITYREAGVVQQRRQRAERIDQALERADRIHQDGAFDPGTDRRVVPGRPRVCEQDSLARRAQADLVERLEAGDVSHLHRDVAGI